MFVLLLKPVSTMKTKTQFISNKLSTYTLKLLILLLGTTTIFAQEKNHQLEVILIEKKKRSNSAQITTNYTVQLFYGNNEMAKKAYYAAKKEFANLDVMMVYTNPEYKVWIGNFDTRWEAEKNAVNIKKKYPNALIIKPNK